MPLRFSLEWIIHFVNKANKDDLTFDNCGIIFFHNTKVFDWRCNRQRYIFNFEN